MFIKSIIPSLKNIVKLLVVPAVMLFPLQALAVTTDIQWSGAVSEVVVDTAGTYSGSSVGSIFSGSFRYGDVLSQTDYGLSNEFYYMLDFDVANVSSGGLTRSGSFLELDVFSDFVCGSYTASPTANLFSCETHSNIAGAQVSEGSLLDGWFLYSAFSENNTSLLFAIDFISRDPGLYSDLDFRELPPFGLDTSDPDFSAVFWVYEIDNIQNELIYGAWGSIDSLSISQIPLPAGVWLFASAMAGLMGFRTKRK